MNMDQPNPVDNTDKIEANSHPDGKPATVDRSLKDDRVTSAIYVFIDSGLSEPERSRAATFHVCRCQMQLHHRGLPFASAELIFLDFGDPSSKTFDRSARRQLLHCVAKGAIDVVAIDSIEQLGATPEEQTEFCAECLTGSVEVHATLHGRVRLKISRPERTAVDERRQRDDAEPDRPVGRQSDDAGQDQNISYKYASVGAAPKGASINRAGSQVLGPLVELYVAGYDAATVADIMNVLDLPASHGASWTPQLVKGALSDIVRISISHGKAATTGSLPPNWPGKASDAGKHDLATFHPQRIGLLAKKLAMDCRQSPRFHASDRRCWMPGSSHSIRRRRRGYGSRADRL